jgi:hypothetical protein
MFEPGGERVAFPLVGLSIERAGTVGDAVV